MSVGFKSTAAIFNIIGQHWKSLLPTDESLRASFAPRGLLEVVVTGVSGALAARDLPGGRRASRRRPDVARGVGVQLQLVLVVVVAGQELRPVQEEVAVRVEADAVAVPLPAARHAPVHPGIPMARAARPSGALLASSARHRTPTAWNTHQVSAINL